MYPFVTIIISLNFNNKWKKPDPIDSAATQPLLK